MDALPNDLSHHWMPFTANRAFKAAPRMLASAEGMYYRTVDGREILDGTAGLWCVNAGHCRAPIVRAIQEEAARLDYAPSFQFGHPQSFLLAERLAALMPDGLDRIFFTNSGSEAAETALKIALAYHRARGDARRVRLIGRERGYHGVNFGGISVGGILGNRLAYGQTLPFVDHLPHTHSLAHQAFSRGQPDWGAHLADELERLVALHGAETIAAVMVEPMAGSTGVLPPPKAYLERLRELCSKYEILLIFDEVITGFGRLGHATAAERFGVTPDIIVLAKGLTNAAVPMGAVAAKREIYDAFMTGPEERIELPHGYTYSAHPLAVAAALATLRVYEEERVFDNARRLEQQWEDAAHAMRDLPGVRDIRNIGITAAIELTGIDGRPELRASRLVAECFRRGLMIRTTADTVALSPPLVLDESHIATMFGTLRAAIEATPAR